MLKANGKKFDQSLPTFVFYIDIRNIQTNDVKEYMEKARDNVICDQFNSFFIPILGDSRIERLM